MLPSCNNGIISLFKKLLKFVTIDKASQKGLYYFECTLGKIFTREKVAGLFDMK